VIVDDVITSGYTFSTVADLAAAQGGRPLGVFVARTEMDGGGKDSVEKLQTV
jgi:adenine/guanine phosphoribosyltransferase-like PRPP-binding protein